MKALLTTAIILMFSADSFANKSELVKLPTNCRVLEPSTSFTPLPPPLIEMRIQRLSSKKARLHISQSFAINGRDISTFPDVTTEVSEVDIIEHHLEPNRMEIVDNIRANPKDSSTFGKNKKLFKLGTIGKTIKVIIQPAPGLASTEKLHQAVRTPGAIFAFGYLFISKDNKQLFRSETLHCWNE
jgi:hypothetical protein